MGRVRLVGSLDALPSVELVVRNCQRSVMNCIMARWANSDHVVRFMGSIDCPMLYVVDMYTPVRAARICALATGLGYQRPLHFWFNFSLWFHFLLHLANPWSPLSPRMSGV
jgi:hypothetical protein